MGMNWKTRNAFFAAVILFQLFSASRISAQNFTPTGSMATARGNFAAALLSNGTVLVAGGGANGPVSLSSAEIFNPTTGTFTPTGNMTTARAVPTGTPLANGAAVLVTGGTDYATSTGISSAEMYNTATGTFTPVGNMTSPRANHTATLLNNGMVLITGGLANPFFTSTVLSSAELYNPISGTFTATGSMTTARWGHTATLLSNGQVLVAGGAQTTGGMSSAEIYDLSTGTFTPTGDMTTGRVTHTATLLNTGQVLISGGGNLEGVVSSAELYVPSTGTFTPTGSMSTARQGHTATLLTNGQVLVAGGSNAGGTVSTAELYGPNNGNFTAFSDFGPGMSYSNTVGWCVSGATTLNCGPATVRWVASPFTPSGNFVLTQVDLPLVYNSGTNGAIVELVNDVDGLPGTSVLESWTLTNLPNTGVVSLVSTGDVTLVGGIQYWLVATAQAGDTLDFWWGDTLGLTGSQNSLDNGASWIPFTGVGSLTAFDVLGTSSPPFSATGSMTTPRASHQAILLNNGTVLIAGGGNASGTLSSAEAYGPALPPPTSKTMTQPLSPTAPTQFQFDNDVHNFTVQYPTGTSFSGVNMSVTAAQTPQATFQQRVTGTPFANAVCIVYQGENGYCEDYQVSCTDTSGNVIACPSEPTATIDVKTSFDTEQTIINPGFLTAPIGTDDFTNIFTAFYLQRIDPTIKGRTTGFSEFFAVDLGASDPQGAASFTFLPPLQQTDVRIFPAGAIVPVEFQLTSVAKPGQAVTDAAAGIDVVMVSDSSGNQTSTVVLEEPSAFHYRHGRYAHELNTNGYAPGTYNLTVYGNAFAAQQVQFSIPVSTSGAQLETQLESITFDSGANQYVATLAVVNTGTAAANGVIVFASGLNFAITSTPLPVSLGDIGAGSSATVTLTYPAFAGRPGKPAFLIVLEAYAGGYGDGFLPLRLP